MRAPVARLPGVAGAGALAAQLAKFMGVGVLATLVHVATADQAHAAFGAAPATANVLGFLCSVPITYLGNFYWTFGRRDGHRRSGSRFVFLAAASFALSHAVVVLSTGAAGLPFRTALLVVTLLVPPATFALSRLWVFDDAPARHVT